MIAVNQTHRSFAFVLTIVLGCASVFLGFMVMMGWHTHTTVLIQLNPNFVPMQYNTALGFIVCGAGLFLLVFAFQQLSQITGLAVSILGFLSLIQYAFTVNHGIVEQSGGFINMESEENKGSTFLLYFPAVYDEERMERHAG